MLKSIIGVETFTSSVTGKCMSIEISLKFVPNAPVEKNPALFQVMAWLQTGD